MKIGSIRETSHLPNMGEVCKWELPGGGAIRLDTDSGAYVVFDVCEIDHIKEAITAVEGRT